MPKRGPKEPKAKLDAKERFLVAFRKWGLKTRALDEADLTLTTLKKWLEEDAAFAKRFDEVAEEIELTRKEDLEEAALRRALVRSDQLVKFLLPALDPRYKEKGEMEHKGAVQVVFRENLQLDDL